ncbi:hypothetical protein HDU92_001161 [Lobulomyces angularis]|nr:hypothetical protein HDU92_001161 [Lobulomyces angularis]
MSLSYLVNEELIRHCGIDKEGKNILTFYLCKLPDPTKNDYNEILQLAFQKLDFFVEEEYVLLIFCSASNYSPSLSWLVNAYNALGRKYKKNIQHLYVIHPSTIAHMFFSAIGNLISPKFYKKIIWVKNLKSLESFGFTLKDIFIPSSVLNYDNQLQWSEENPVSTSETIVNTFWSYFSPSLTTDNNKLESRTLIFGMKNFDEYCLKYGQPKVLEECYEYIEKEGLDTEGLFRIAPLKSLTDMIKERYNEGEEKVFLSNVHVACSLIKNFYFELKEPIIRKSFYETVKKMEEFESKLEKIDYLKKEILQRNDDEFSRYKYENFKMLFKLLHKVYLKKEKNLMNSNNLAIVLCPNFVRSEDVVEDMKLCSGGLGSCVKLMIEEYEEVFDSEQKL